MAFSARNPLLSFERWTLLQVHSLARRLQPRNRIAPHLATGERGEFEALFFLRKQGYRVIERRWRTTELRGDIDLIAWDGEHLCFIEVKTRTARDMTPAASAIDHDKRSMLRRMAAAYRRTMPRQRDLPVPTRGDIVSVYLLGGRPQCELMRGAISLQWESPGNVPAGYGV